MEIHPCPEKAVSDGAQSLTLPQFAAMMNELKPYINLWKESRVPALVSGLGAKVGGLRIRLKPWVLFTLLAVSRVGGAVLHRTSEIPIHQDRCRHGRHAPAAGSDDVFPRRSSASSGAPAEFTLGGPDLPGSRLPAVCERDRLRLHHRPGCTHGRRRQRPTLFLSPRAVQWAQTSKLCRGPRRQL